MFRYTEIYGNDFYIDCINKKKTVSTFLCETVLVVYIF